MGDVTYYKADEVKERPGSFGLTYCIPIRELPSADFYALNSKAGINTFRAVANLAWKGGNGNVKVALQEQKQWKWIQCMEYATMTGTSLVGGAIGYQMKFDNLISVPNSEQILPMMRQMTAVGGAAIALLIADQVGIYNYHNHLCTALASKTPLGDFARASLDYELSKDLGQESIIGYSAEFWQTSKEHTRTAVDAAVPGSVKNILTNI